MGSILENTGYWNAITQEVDFPQHSGELNVDVAIIGGGIVGITAARLLKDKGLTVAVIEAGKVGRQVSGKSTAKVTSQHGLLYHQLVNKFSMDEAGVYANAQEAGLAEIRRLAATHSIDCDLESCSAYAYTLDPDKAELIQKEVEIVTNLGLPAQQVQTTSLPFAVEAAICYENQAQFNPVSYIAGLAGTLPGTGSHVFENTRAISYESKRVNTALGRVNASQVIMATHLPSGLTGAYYSRAFPTAKPLIAAKINRIPEGMYIRTEEPGYSIRTHSHSDGDRYAIAVGSGFKPGDTEAERKSFQALESWLTSHFQAETISYRWTNEDYHSMDSVPYVGRSSSFGGDYLIATGFAGWGFTNATAAAIMLTDILTDTSNPWLDLFDAKRFKLLAGGGKLLKESAGVVSDLVSEHLKHHSSNPENLPTGKAAIMDIEGKKVAVYKDEQHQLHMVSATCTHLGCIVGWNETEKTWDCSCHGSRFALDGSIIHGPAEEPLDPWKP